MVIILMQLYTHKLYGVMLLQLCVWNVGVVTVRKEGEGCKVKFCETVMFVLC